MGESILIIWQVTDWRQGLIYTFARANLYLVFATYRYVCPCCKTYMAKSNWLTTSMPICSLQVCQAARFAKLPIIVVVTGQTTTSERIY